MTRLALCGLLGLAVAGCAEDRGGGSPEEVARQFISAVREADPQQVYRLLAPEDRASLERLAQVANAQAGGGQQLKPFDMLAVGQEPPEAELGEIEVGEVKGDRASATLISADRKVRQELKLVRAEGKWYVELPAKLLKKEAASQPARP